MSTILSSLFSAMARFQADAISGATQDFPVDRTMRPKDSMPRAFADMLDDAPVIAA